MPGVPHSYTRKATVQVEWLCSLNAETVRKRLSRTGQAGFYTAERVWVIKHLSHWPEIAEVVRKESYEKLGVGPKFKRGDRVRSTFSFIGDGTVVEPRVQAGSRLCIVQWDRKENQSGRQMTTGKSLENEDNLNPLL